jgi:hypothetical protein
MPLDEDDARAREQRARRLREQINRLLSGERQPKPSSPREATDRAARDAADARTGPNGGTDAAEGAKGATRSPPGLKGGEPS